MRRRTTTTACFFISLLTTFSIFATFSLYLTRQQSTNDFTTLTNPSSSSNTDSLLLSISEESERVISSTVYDSNPDAILMPDWEILLVFSPDHHLSSFSDDDRFTCVFQNNDTSPAKLVGILPFDNRATFKCVLPYRVRRLRPFLQPIFKSSSQMVMESESSKKELFRWGFLAYESLSTETDVILFAKGVNSRQGLNRSPEDLHCVFSNGGHNTTIKTAVTSSKQEVFRCRHPDISAFLRIGAETTKISLEITKANNSIVPSVAYYTPLPRNLVKMQQKSLICACTMVYNVGKFLKEWVIYHSVIGVEKFFLYDNGSDDDLQDVVNELRERNYQVETILWPWSKTQEAGFSHSATYANDMCTWMMYVDVDEFIYSPSWLKSPNPSSDMLKSLLPRSQRVGQVMVKCYEFGPSNQMVHPRDGVTQGYTCRTRMEQRHKSIVLLDAVDISLRNVVHHFQLRNGYRVKKMSLDNGVVNHYKYQAWSEFRTKFRRRVSAYVVDWKQGVNLKSKDRTPGLGFEPIEPKGWPQRFCDVHDYRLRDATRRWFRLDSSSDRYKMGWQEL
ncbi:hypothetical protein ACHQM5_024346 [Ranunculus cassubicifolius]